MVKIGTKTKQLRPFYVPSSMPSNPKSISDNLKGDPISVNRLIKSNGVTEIKI